MKKLSILILLLSSTAQAVTFEIKNLCNGSSYHKEQIQVLLPTTVGHLSVYAFDASNIEYVGNEDGINSILGTPVGLEAVEVLSNTHMRIYGWCYEVDGVRPKVMPSEYAIDPLSDCKLTWYYGYGEQIDGEWVNYCTPITYSNSFACSKN